MISGACSMNTLRKLEVEKVNLSRMMVDVSEAIQSTEQQLEQSFTGNGDSDKLSQKLAQLVAKRNGVANAINSTANSIITEEQRLVNDEKQVDLDQRKQHVKDALKSLDRASKLQGELSTELQKVMDHNTAALFRNNSEIEKSVRGLVGRLAAEFKLHGALQMAANIPVPTSADYKKLITHINEF